MISFDIIKNYLIIVLLGLGIGIYVYKEYKISSLNSDIQDLNSKLEITNSEKENYKAQVTLCASNLQNVNAQLKQSSEEVKQQIKKFEEYKNLPKEVKYETIYKTIKGNSNECKDIKDTINVIRNLNYNIL